MGINLKNKKISLANINMVFKGRNEAIKFVDDYASIVLEAKRKAAEEELEPQPSKAKKFPLELRKEFMNEIKNNEKIINERTFEEYFLSYFITLSKRII